MATPFLSSEEYDERAHKLYDEGDLDSALATLKEGINLYPHSVELYVGLGYTRLAREEFAWARQAFERATVLDPEHEDGMVGLGEALLRLGATPAARELFRRAREACCGEDLDLLMTMGRALYRESLFLEAKDVFEEAVGHHAGSAEAAAALGYTLHRIGEETAARRQLRRALHLDSELHETRVFLGHLLYDRGDWSGALREFGKVPPAEHWDPLAIWRLVEMKKLHESAEPGSADLLCWETRLQELEADVDPIDELLAEIEGQELAATLRDPVRAHRANPDHLVQLPDGDALTGTWLEIVRQLRDVAGQPDESIDQFMRRRSTEERVRTGVALPTEDPQEFVLAGARAGHWQVEY